MISPLEWSQTLSRTLPLAQIRELYRFITERGEFIAKANGLDSESVVSFLLERSRALLLQGAMLSTVLEALPRNLEELGALKIAKGGVNGTPLSDEELKKVKPKGIIH